MSHVTIFTSYHAITPGLCTNETWMLQRRKAIPGVQPAAYFRPEDFVPEPFGCPHGIPLYRLDQTRPYDPTPATVASQHYYDFFVASQNRHRHSRWDDGKRKYGPDVKPTWRTYDKYLSRAKVRDHLRGKDIYGGWADLGTNWFALDVDYHGGDFGLFLDTLDILQELRGFFPEVRWVYILNRSGISGLHVLGLLPAPRLLEEVRGEVQKMLTDLEEKHIERLRTYKPEGLDADNYHPLVSLELYPATNHNFRLPYAPDRITVTDQWLNRPGEVDLKPNLVKFMAYVRDASRQALPLAEVIEYVRANIRWKPPKQPKPSRSGKLKRTSRGSGMGKIEPLKGRHLEFLTGVVLGTEPMPQDTIGSWAAPALRHLMLVDGLDAEAALLKVEEFYESIPDKRFSDRLSGHISELLRTDAYTAAKIEDGNLYQPRPEESTAIFARVQARCQQIGFVFADPSTWHVLGSRKAFPFDLAGLDFSLTFEEKLAVKEPGLALLKCDTASVYQAAHLVKAFVTKYPGKELPATLLPPLCADLPISWRVPSDNGTRCKKAERFLSLLCSLGVIKVLRPKQWYGVGHPANRAAVYGLPKDETVSALGRRWYYAHWTRHSPQDSAAGGRGEGEGIYIRDISPLTEQDIDELILEVERLNRPWKPQYHSSG
jgi:hypothetical protein